MAKDNDFVMRNNRMRWHFITLPCIAFHQNKSHHGMALHCIHLFFLSLPYITLHHILRAWCLCTLHNTHHLHRHYSIINSRAFILHEESQRYVQCLLSSWDEIRGESMRCRWTTLCWQRKVDHRPPLVAVTNCPASSAMTASCYEVALLKYHLLLTVH